MITVQLSNKLKYTFHEDLSMKALHDLGSEPTSIDNLETIMIYNKKKIAAFSIEPKLSLAIIDEMCSFDFMKIVKEVLLSYNDRLQHFLQTPEIPEILTITKR